MGSHPLLVPGVYQPGVERIKQGAGRPVSSGCVALGNPLPSLSPGCHRLDSPEAYKKTSPQGLSADTQMPTGQATWDATITCLFIGPPKPAEGRNPLKFQPGSQMQRQLWSLPECCCAAQPRGLKLILELAGGITHYTNRLLLSDAICKYHLQKEVN